MRFPSYHVDLEASLTLLDRRSAPTVSSTQSVTPHAPAAAGPSTRRRSWDDVICSPLWRRAARRIMPEPQADARAGIRMQNSSYDPKEEMEAEEELKAEEEDCVELICIEDSIEVVDLSSDSEMEEDPSECSSAPAYTRTNR
uniref:Uncharacterized protein n=1 Tax=Lupinus angustifolius TaxID=3871 RepID=L0P196_LUPAN|nr:hypothetical protein [Lupinus angustifolius]